mmetsp:Transcript_94245/g.184784  ORF Transcript_94245/g.184784 Transcript_94245/m.184784 type:complete len:195 (-) Transcript_94245:56-640(-)
MGCCASRKDDDNIELLEGANESVCCRNGQKGPDIDAEAIPGSASYKVAGTGTMLGSCCLDCDTAMWEVKVGKNPEGLKIGVKKYQKKFPGDLSAYLDSEHDPNSPSWFLQETELNEGDVVGVYWDQTDLPMVSFSVNGKMVSYCVTRIRPTIDIFPAVSVQQGSTCELVFQGKDFKFPPKSSKFQMIICASNLI